MAKRQLDEPSYYAFAAGVGLQRHFNVQTAKMLGAYGFDPLSFLEHQNQAMPEHIGPGNYAQWLVEDCHCPMTLLRAFVANNGDQDELDDVVAHIASGLVPTTEASLRRWGDPNHFTPQLLRKYCAPDGTPLDEQALNLSDDCRNVEICQLVDFIVEHPRGQLSYRKPETLGQRIGRRFEAVAGFRLSEAYAHQLLAMMSARYRTQEPEEPPF